MAVLTDLRNRGLRDVFFVVCDGLKGLPEVVGQCVAPDADGAGLHDPPDPQHLPAHFPEKYWGTRLQTGPETDLHSGHSLAGC